MDLRIDPGVPSGTVTLPPSKSLTHRYLLCAALAQGVSRVSNVDLSGDVRATLGCLTALGVPWSYADGTVTVTGKGPAGLRPTGPLDCRESGSTLRFLLPLCLSLGVPVTLTGTKTLLSRPLGPYADLCAARGLRFEKTADALTVCGPLTPGDCFLPGDVSSQFVTGLLLALPLLPGDSRIRLTARAVSAPYLDLTLAALERFGVTAERTETGFFVPGNQAYRPADVTVEDDLTAAAVFLALSEICSGQTAFPLRGRWHPASHGSRMTDEVFLRSGQGDRVFPDLLKALQAGTPTISLRDCPDLGPILFVLAAALHGAVFTDAERLRYKESDRLAAMLTELRKCGCELAALNGRVTVPGGLRAPKEPLDGHNDHRIVMALAVLLARYGGVIRGAEAVGKSFPGFFDQLRALNVQTEEVTACEYDL